MPIIKPVGLRGLGGVDNLSKAQYDAFVNRNQDLIAQHGYDPVYIKNLYSNKQFIDKYGIEKFKAIPDIEIRNDLYKGDLVNAEFDKLYKPTKTNKGLGNDYFKYSQLSTDAKLKLLESDYLSPTEFETQWQKHLKENQHIGNTISNNGWGLPDPSMGGLFSGNSAKESFAEAYKDPVKDEAIKRKAMDANQKILDSIYNDDVDAATDRYGADVSTAYQDIATRMTDSQVKKAFIQAITPGSYKDKNGMLNMGIPEFASHYGKGTNNDITSEMKNFSIDDMRQTLAKKQVYDANMSPDMAATALNNDAKRYIKEHQGRLKKLGLFAKDVAISSMSYTADKLNGIAEIYRMGQDRFADKPIVMVDDRGTVLDPNKTHVIKDGQGNLRYQDKEGRIHSVHQEKIDYTTLHNMGKNTDGSDIEGAFGVDWMTLNPQYWTRAEQFGTLDNEEQKQYEKLGSSPYKVAYNPNEDSDLWYEAFKMMSFGLADTAAQLIPYGIGSVGKVLSTASKVGKVARGFGKVLDTTGKLLTAETKIGQAAQGAAGALGIAYAYDRGAFQETLQQNLANAEEAVTNVSKADIYNQYHKDKNYKAQVDKLIGIRAAALKNSYIRQMQRDGGMQIVDEQALDRMFRAKAQDAVLGELVQNRVKERISSKEYAALQQEAINSAGDAAFNTFLPEAVKYGFVNTMGYRKFLYTNPSGLTKKMSSTLKGLKEMTTSAGRKRMTTEASKFLTRGDKLKEFGKTFGSQLWGGAWTNGTDDMQVDAAERINEDSYNQYLKAYQNGEAMAGTYGFADGLYSYLKGLSNSLGQETTLNSALVGGLGSIVNFTPNFANIARLATKEGRQAYKDNFRREVVRDKDGIPVRNEDGSLKYKELGKGNNWRGQLNYFLQNGVLNTYYGKKQAEKDLQSHADYVNNLLDDYHDFTDIESLVASNIASENTENFGDKKTMDFVRALHAINTLDKLGEDSKDPTTLSSVVQNAKAFIEKAAQLNQEEGNNPFSEEEIGNLLSQYYASHPGIEQNDYNNQKALYEIAENAQKLQEASAAFDKAEKEIQKVERNQKIDIDPIVRNRMKEQQALNDHWMERKEKMQSEIDDASTDETSDNTLDAATAISSIGGVKNAQSLIKVYDRQIKEIEQEIAEEKKKAQPILDKFIHEKETLEKARRDGDINGSLKAQDNISKIEVEQRNYYKQKEYLENLLTLTQEKKKKYEDGIKEMETASKETDNQEEERVLTADEIFSLDPVTRARMLNDENRELYSKSQQREIEKLEQRLLMRDADALQKVQDIALLTQRIHANQDAYTRIAKDPEAAAFELEEQRVKAAKTAYDLINQRNAETVADFIQQFEDGMKDHADVTKDKKEQFVFKTLRKLSPTLLDIMDDDSLIPQYKQQVTQAKEWAKTVGDIGAVIEQSDKNEEWKNNILKNIDALVENSNNKAEIMEKLEKIVDDTDGSNASKDMELILNGLENIGYQRDATAIENRKKRKEREEERKKKQEEEKKKKEEIAKKAAEKQVAKKSNNAEKEIDRNADAEAKGELEDGIDTSDEPNVNAETQQGQQEQQAVEPHKEGNITINYDKPFFVTSEEYEALPETAEHDEKATFEVHSSVKDGKNWYFIGNFADSKEQTKVKATKKLMEDNGYIQQKEEVATDDAVTSANLDVTDEHVKGRPETLEEQLAQAAKATMKEMHISDADSENSAVLNGTGEFSIDNDSITLSGNAMSRYNHQALADEGRLEKRVGEKDNDKMNKYFSWMDAAGINLQGIIDHELARILYKNPHAKVKFMLVKSDRNATHDVDMQDHCMLVLDYDNKINKSITAIHDDANGGVIESNGKKYLIVGVAGYGKMNPDKYKLYRLLLYTNEKNGLRLNVRRKQFFDTHPQERYYVNEEYSTEVVPTSQIPGYIVKQMVDDKFSDYRSVMELLADEKRNPLHYTLETASWGIQQMNKFLIVGTSPDKVMTPRDVVRNMGSAFVLMPASNGKMVPSYLRALKYTEMREGTLKDKVDRLLNELVVRNQKVRFNAIGQLNHIFYLNNEGDDIQLSKHDAEISLVHNGEITKTFVLGSNFDRTEFMRAIEDLNPRINITADVLSNMELLKEYDEAGALMTDAALFGTAGSSYSVYGLDTKGNMIVPAAPVNETAKPKNSSDFKNEKSQVIYDHQYYMEDNGVFSLNGETVTDETLIKQLQYNKTIMDGELVPAESKGVWDSYILSTGEHPMAIRRNRNTKKVKELSEEDVKELVERIAKERADKQREEAAQQIMEKESKEEPTEPRNGEDVDLGGGFEVDPETGEMVMENKHDTTLGTETKSDEKDSTKETTQKEDLANESTETIHAEEQKATTQDVTALLNDRGYKMKIIKSIRTKWKGAPKDAAELKEFLKSKDIEVDNIGTSKTDIDAWIKTMEDCR